MRRLFFSLLSGLLILLVAQLTQALPTFETVLVNQLGYVPGATKIGVVVDSTNSPGTVEVLNSSGTIVFTGPNTIFKTADQNSGDAVHHADFSDFTTEGTNYTVRVTIGSTVYNSHPFDISSNLYGDLKLAKAGFKVLYFKRKGMAVMDDPEFNVVGHPAGHGTDNAMSPYGNWRANTVFDVDGGWYDAGDFGIYAESQAMTAWAVMNTYERFKDLGLSTLNLNIDESGSAYPLPDVLDEIAWGSRHMTGLLPDPDQHITAPTRTDLAANKCANHNWSAYPQTPAGDTGQPRDCMGPSTSATHSVVRNLAQLSRLLRPHGTATTNIDINGITDISAGALADLLWARAKEAYGRATGIHADFPNYTGAGVHAINFSESPGFNVGSGPYQDDDADDDKYAAAVELYLAACERGDNTAAAKYKTEVIGHAYYTQVDYFDWGSETSLQDALGEEKALGTLSLLAAHSECTGTNALPAIDITTMENNLKGFADKMITSMNGQNYPHALADGAWFPWGSNKLQGYGALALVQYYEISNNDTYLKGAFRLLDYVFGVNPMNRSYVSGYGENAITVLHDRPMAALGLPKGTIAGGPLNIQQFLVSSQRDPSTPKSGPAMKRFADSTGGNGGSSWESEEDALDWTAGLIAAAVALDHYESSLGACISNCPPTANAVSASTNKNMPVDITLEGSDPNGTIVSYNYTQPTNGSVTGTGPIVTFTPNTNYVGADSFTYTVTDDENLTSDPATVSINISDPTLAPAAPTGLLISAVTSNQVDLDWADNTESDLSHYSVKRSNTTGGPYTQIASNLTTSNYSDTSVVPLTSYYYVVTASDTNANESAESAEVSATTPDLPADPCVAPTVITGPGEYPVSTTGTCFKYTNASFKNGAMFSVRNLLTSNHSNTLEWFGVMDQNQSSCINQTVVIQGNGGQLNNFAVDKDANNAMFLKITGSVANTVNISIQNWQNGPGC